MTLLVAGDNVTVPVPWSTRPAEVVAMLSMNCGSWKSTGPDGGWPRSVSDTDRPLDEILRLSLRPSVVGKFVTEIGRSSPSHWAGTPRPTTRAPSVRCGHQRGQQHAVGLRHSPGVGGGALPGRRVPSQPRGMGRGSR